MSQTSKITGPVDAVMRPGTFALSRLRYAQKFALIGLVLILPLAFVCWSYVSQQRAQVRFADSERIGLRYISPATRVLDEVIKARSAAVAGALVGRPVTSTPPALLEALGVMDAADKRYGDRLGVRESWAKEREAITTAASAGADAQESYTRYSGATAGLIAVIAQVGENSNLLLDPDVDSFYLMDTVVYRLPQLADDAGKTADLGALIASRELAAGGRRERDEFTLANSALVTATNVVGANLAKVPGATSDQQLLTAAVLEAPAKSMALAAQKLSGTSASAATSTGSGTADAARYHAASAKLRETAEPALDRLLAARIAGFQRAAYVVALVALGGASLAAYLFYAFYRSAALSVRAVVAATQRLAAGDLTTSVRVDGRDELFDIASALNTAIERMRDALSQISTHAGSLGNASVQVAAVSRSLVDVAAQSEDRSVMVAASAEEVAQQVGVVVTEQLAVSLNDFASTAVSATEVLDAANRAVVTVSENKDRMERLASSSQAIGEFVELIAGVAEQTKLLALNATIEAAHAGEAGKSFGVVAGEVKELARETAEASTSISERIKGIQLDADLAIEAARDARNAIVEIQESQQVIAVSMEEQTILASGIGRSLGDAVERSTSVARDVAHFARTAGETTHSARELSRSAIDLAVVASELEGVVDDFRT